MTREEKASVIAELTETLKSNPYFYIVDAGGMTVEDTNKFRRLCFQKGIGYKVAKNALIRKVLVEIAPDSEAFCDESLKGFSGILYSNEAGAAPAKLLQEFRKANPKPLLKGACVEASYYVGDDQLEALTKVKSKKDLLGDLVGLLNSPARNLVSALQSGGQKIAGILKTLEERESK